jgi:hypothetical protein
VQGQARTVRAGHVGRGTVAAQLIEKYEAINELTAPLLNELIDKIEVHQAHKDENGNKVREFEIYYRFVGKIE